MPCSPTNSAWAAARAYPLRHSPALWPTNAQPATLNREFACCTYPVDASFATTPGDALAYTFTNASSGAGTVSWSIGGANYSGDVVEHAFPAPGTYTVCITVEGVCATDIQCEEIAVASTGLDEWQAKHHDNVEAILSKLGFSDT